MKTEYTNATTTGLINAASKTWDEEIIGRCGYPRGLFGEIATAGTILGKFTDEVRQSIGYSCAVALPPTHDTASAFLATPAESDDSVFISSGTWSLTGVELESPITTEESRAANFTNEGGYGYRYRFLKNIMGLWMLQSVRSEIGKGVGFTDLEALARISDYDALVDVNESRFFAPDSMTTAIRNACREGGHPEPQSPGDLARCICRSLAHSYAQTVEELETLTGKQFRSINIVGGGSRQELLNELTSSICGLPVYAGPVECTALGNILSQMIAHGELPDVETARETVRRSFDIKVW